MKKKIVFVGYVDRKIKWMYWFPGRYDCKYLETQITLEKFDKDDIKVRITAEEI